MSVADEDLYELFELDQSAGDREIALAFRRLAKRWHPDLNSTHEATERMQQISGAYEVLRDPDRRAAYDRALCPEPLASATTAGVSSTRQRASTATAEPWWAFAASSPAARVIEDPDPPPGYQTPPHWFSMRAATRSRVRRAPRTASREREQHQ
jgi:curved DNA-binding protein CbpA